MIIKYNDPGTLRSCVQILGKNGIIIIKCDTMYGFIGTAPETGSRISRIKQRSQGKPFLQLIPDKSWIKRFSSAIIPDCVSDFWPGPLTLIIPEKGSRTVGLRVPDDPFLQEILRHIQKPLFSTSVNRQGSEPLEKINEIIIEFENEVDLIIDSGDMEESIPSTILDVSSKPYRIVRQGRIVIPPEFLSGE